MNEIIEKITTKFRGFKRGEIHTKLYFLIWSEIYINRLFFVLFLDR